MDAQAQLHTLKTKDAASTSHAVHLEEARKAAAKEAEESGATLRLAQIELEQEKTGRKEVSAPSRLHCHRHCHHHYHHTTIILLLSHRHLIHPSGGQDDRLPRP